MPTITIQTEAQQQEVHVYTGEHLGDMKVCLDEMTCSASPVLRSFQISVRDIFAKTSSKKT